MKWLRRFKERRMGLTPEQQKELEEHREALKQIEIKRKHEILIEEEYAKSADRVMDFKNAPEKKAERKKAFFDAVKGIGEKVNSMQQQGQANKSGGGGSAIDKVTDVFGGGNSGGSNLPNPLAEFGQKPQPTRPRINNKIKKKKTTKKRRTRK